MQKQTILNTLDEIWLSLGNLQEKHLEIQDILVAKGVEQIEVQKLVQELRQSHKHSVMKLLNLRTDLENE